MDLCKSLPSWVKHWVDEGYITESLLMNSTSGLGDLFGMNGDGRIELKDSDDEYPTAYLKLLKALAKMGSIFVSIDPSR